MNNAANISRKYGNYDCVSCITELALSLPGKILKIDVRTVTHTRPFIMHVSLYQDSAISDTGIHYGFLYDGKVYDNIHHDGIERSIWVTNFIFFNPAAGRESSVAEKYVTQINCREFLSREKNSG